MDPEDEREIKDVIREATSPGKTQARVLTVERRRAFLKAAEMLANPNATFDGYIRAIREIEPREDSPEFVQAVNLWYRFRRKP
jgi:hypothetical protein